MPARSILIVEDDLDLQQTLNEQLTREGFAVTSAATMDDAEHGIEQDRFDAILLDLSLPDGDGMEFLREQREAKLMIPIIIITGTADDAQVVAGLDAGANDYIVKPFRLKELLARLQAQLRQYDISNDATFVIGPYVFHPSTKTLTNARRRIRLTAKECEILKFMYRQPNMPISRRDLLNEVWSYNSGVTTHTLETHIYRLRQKIEPDPTNCSLIISIEGGYVFNPRSHPV